MHSETRTYRAAAMWSARRSGRGALAVAASLTVLGVWGPVGPARAAGPLTLTARSPSSGPVGTLVTLNGSGLTGQDVVRFNGTPTAPTTVNATGTSLEARVPAFATSGVISVEDPASGQMAELPNAPFTVTQGVYAAPDHVWAGGRLTFSGSALTPDHRDPIYISGVLVGYVVTDLNGNFQVGVSVPWDTQSGKLPIYVIDSRFRLTTVLFVLGDWPQFRHDSEHVGLDTWETSLTRTSVPKLTIKWSYPTAAAVTASPIVADGMLYLAAHNGTLYVDNVGTGKPLWNYTMDSAITGTPAVDNGRVFVLSSTGRLDAVNATTGKFLWYQATEGGSDSSPAAANGVVYVPTYYGENLYAFNEATGKLLWLFHAAGGFDSPAVANGIVYAGSQDGYVYAVNASTGKLVWKRATGKIVESSPAVAGGKVFIGTDSGAIYALDASTGAVAWSVTPDGYPIYASPAVSGGLVFIDTEYGFVYALDAATGKSAWKTGLTPLLESSPAIANGVLYVGSTNYELNALDTSTGHILWSKALGLDPSASAVVSDGRVYIMGSASRWVYSLGL